MASQLFNLCELREIHATDFASEVSMLDPWDSECELMPHGCLGLGGGGGGHCLNWLIYKSRVVGSVIRTLRNQDGDARHKTVGKFQKRTA